MGEELIAFSRRLLGPGADEVGQIVGDWARLWRIKNLISIKKKFERICQEQGIDPSEGRYLHLSPGGVRRARRPRIGKANRRKFEQPLAARIGSRVPLTGRFDVTRFRS